MEKKVVFFGCSMRGGYGVVSQEDLAKLPDVIEKLGYKLASRHQTQVGIVAKENEQTPPYIHDRDYCWLKGADVGVFEISNPSLGAGAEIADMIHEGKPVLCLFKGDEKAVSAYIRGMQGSEFVKTSFECHAYVTLDDAKTIIDRFMSDNIAYLR
ncbi:MAG: nucleoside 2-deoxyribosyltransferase [Patescibacteria group bacterium]